MKQILILNFVFWLAGCASTHPGKMAQVLDGGDVLMLRMSARDVSTENDLFKLLEVTIENTSDEWLRIDQVRPEYLERSQKISVVLGDDLLSWTEAMVAKEAKDKHNKQLAQVSLVAFGIGMSAVGHQKSSENAEIIGALAMSGAYGWALSDALTYAYRKSIGIDSKTPSNHLYESFSVPPKMALRRWILFNWPSNEEISSMTFHLLTIEGSEQRYEVQVL